MKLYSKPGACSTADHIALQWSGQPFEVELLTMETLKGPEFLQLNPAGKVPLLVDGDLLLTQNAAIMGYIADKYPQAGLGGDGSPRQRAEASRWLAFVNSDLHPAFSPLFAPGKFTPDQNQFDTLRSTARQRLRELFESVDKHLATTTWLAGFRSFADPYFYITLRWAEFTKVDLSGLEHLAAYKARLDADAGVQAALQAEGLA
jgi:glutathione S-transferase